MYTAFKIIYKINTIDNEHIKSEEIYISHREDPVYLKKLKKLKITLSHTTKQISSIRLLGLDTNFIDVTW